MRHTLLLCSLVLTTVPVLAGAEAMVLAASASGAPGCVGPGALGPGEQQRLERFAVLPKVWETWQERECYPRILSDEALSRVSRPVGIVISVAGHDALVIDPGHGWLEKCEERGIPVGYVEQVLGADLLRVKERIELSPVLSKLDILEIGLSRGRTKKGRPLHGLYVGTRDRTAMVVCYQSMERLLERVTEVFQNGSS